MNGQDTAKSLVGSCNWVLDCCDKEDFDFPIVTIAVTRNVFDTNKVSTYVLLWERNGTSLLGNCRALEVKEFTCATDKEEHGRQIKAYVQSIVKKIREATGLPLLTHQGGNPDDLDKEIADQIFNVNVRQFDLLRISTRSYGDNSAYPALLLQIEPRGEYIVLARETIETLEECAKTLAEQWIEETITGPIDNIIDAFAK